GVTRGQSVSPTISQTPALFVVDQPNAAQQRQQFVSGGRRDPGVGAGHGNVLVLLVGQVSNLPSSPWKELTGSSGRDDGKLQTCPTTDQRGGLVGRGRLYQARSHTSRSFSSSFTSTAARLSLNCSTLLAPMMADVSPGCRSTQATATLTSETFFESKCR